MALLVTHLQRARGVGGEAKQSGNKAQAGLFQPYVRQRKSYFSLTSALLQPYFSLTEIGLK